MTAQPKLISADIEIGDKTVRVATSLYNGVTYLAARYMYEDKATGELKYGKNGINMPLDEAPQILLALIQTYYDSTGTDLQDKLADDYAARQ